ncbi:MAG: DNA mismatch repair endonuclease MutL [Leptolyngbya sp. SIO4C1]|nr:DNA mismatch repair endonuclease MutL [Leptolyngbya sp. SIO4C1]
MQSDAVIQPLSPAVISLIAAGEVIDSLAATVRELAENALDAGATRIHIQLWPQQWRVRVADNGSGMSLVDLEQAATAHSTSKIRTRADLSHICSLGFRGEALHSLAQLSTLEIVSRPQSDASGWHIRYSQEGRPTTVETAAIAPGTIVTAADLFACWPTRRQALPSVAQQLRAVQLIVQQLALCHPAVTWQVTQAERNWFTLWPGQTAQAVLPQLLRGVVRSDLAQLTLDAEQLAVSQGQLALLVGLPDRCHRHRPDWIRVAVNGRVVNAPVLSQALIHSFRRTLPRDRYPVCFLHLRVPPEQVDWNRHPAKSDIYLQNMEDWCDRISAAVVQILRLHDLNQAGQAQRVQQLIKVAEQAGPYNTGPDNIGANNTGSDSIAARAQGSAQTLPARLKAVAQVRNTYILAEHSGGLCLIEQHIAHERVLYEQLQARWQTVPLEPPMILSQLRSQQVAQLRRLGLEIDPFGEDLWAVRTLPAALQGRDDCAEALIELSLGGDIETALVAVACRTAIRNGTPLSPEQLQPLLDDWQRTRHPHTCPHGRPICLSLAESSLSRYFRRHWVIGKSHGV